MEQYDIKAMFQTADSQTIIFNRSESICRNKISQWSRLRFLYKISNIQFFNFNLLKD